MPMNRYKALFGKIGTKPASIGSGENKPLAVKENYRWAGSANGAGNDGARSFVHSLSVPGQTRAIGKICRPGKNDGEKGRAYGKDSQ
jgi:hypothetical protein